MRIFKILLSDKQEIEIDEQEFNSIIPNLEKGRLVKVKQGIFNPSFIIAIVPTQKQIQDDVDGYVDEATGKFIVTSRKPKGLENKFAGPLKDERKQLSDNKKI